VPLGLALSGGGFRATLFHLGVIQGLRALDQLRNVTDVSGVSGGSILAAHLVDNWNRYIGPGDQFAQAAEEIIELAQRDVRGRVLRSRSWRTMAIVPLFFNGSTIADRLEAEYATLLGNGTFADVRAKAVTGWPSLAILSTSLTTGQLVGFHLDGITFWPGNDLSDVRTTSLARAVAASAAFPILSNPIPITRAELGFEERRGTDHLLTDGGVYDNLGAIWLAIAAREASRVPLDRLIVSDAGRPFDWKTARGLFSRNMRANDLLMWRLAKYDAKRVRRCVGSCQVLSIGHRYTHKAPADHPNMRDRLSACRIRTDLNCFFNDEVELLRRHGRCVALDMLGP